MILNYKLLDLQIVLNLLGKSEDPCEVIGTAFDQNIMMPEYKKENDVSALYYINFYLLYLNYLFENYEKAYKYLLLIEPYISSQISHPMIPIKNFYHSLILLSIYPEKKKSEQKKLMKQIIKNQEDLKKWMEFSPDNCINKYYLVEAELARVLGKEQEARNNYNLAISKAHENQFIQEEALAFELLAKFWLGLNEKKIASIYIKEAYQAYKIWYCNAKLKHFDEKYTNLLKLDLKSPGTISEASTISTTTSTKNFSESLDLSTMMKTSQTLSSEIELKKLLEIIMKLSIENAGAQKGFLILMKEEDNKLFIEAEAGINKEIKVLESIPINEKKDISSSIVNYVKSTGEDVVLHDAHKEGDFVDDPYIKNNKIKSILCTRITHKGKMSGILYLENNISTGTFTNERTLFLRILSSQAAISIENARLLVHRESSAKLEKEMEIAATIQTSLLPKHPLMEGYEIAAHMKPADDVGGDYYDIINIGDMDWVIIGDVSGHGVPAGLVMIMVQTCIHHTLYMFPELTPSKLLENINNTIAGNLELMDEHKYMTLTALVTNGDGSFTHSGLHQDIMVYRAKTGEVDLIETDGYWIGLLKELENLMVDNTFQLYPGDTMLIYTDGITEAWKKGTVQNNRDIEKDMFGEIQLQNILSKTGASTPGNVIDTILKEMENYYTNDDVTMVAIKRL